jgi:hypothetical protein
VREILTVREGAMIGYGQQPGAATAHNNRAQRQHRLCACGDNLTSMRRAVPALSSCFGYRNSHAVSSGKRDSSQYVKRHST